MVPSQAVLSAVAVAGLVLGLLGCSLALWSWRRQRALQSRLGRLEEAAIREQGRRTRRARLQADLEQQVEISRVLVIRNAGPAAASGITVSLGGVPLDHSSLIDHKKLDGTGAETLPAGRQLRLPLVARELPEEVEVEVTWSDATGDLGFVRMTFGTSVGDSHQD